MADHTDIVVICGGHGSRIPSLSSRFQCKSLIPFYGRPAIEYVLRAARRATGGRIILCVDRRSLVAPLEQVIHEASVENVQFYMDNGRGPMPAMYEVSAFCKGDRVLVLFGHHLVAPQHLSALLNIECDSVAVSLFRTTSESHCKITAVRTDRTCIYASRFAGVIPIKPGEFYVDLPYLLPSRFFLDTEYSTVKRWFIKGNLPKSILGNDEKVFGVEADFPHEFHNLADVNEVELFAERLAGGLGGASWLT